MSLADPDFLTLTHDFDVATPLERLAYVDGMLLGADAVRAEQEYHRRRLNRERYWTGRIGCVVGLRVSVTANEVDSASPFDPTTLRLLVAPGVAYDGLGREVFVHEEHCLDLYAWLDAWLDAKGELDGTGTREFAVWARNAACPRGMQPVLADRLNDSTDAVAFSRTGDGVLLELERISDEETFTSELSGKSNWQTLMVEERSKHAQTVADGVDPWVESGSGRISPAERSRLDALTEPTETEELERRLRLINAVELEALLGRPADQADEAATLFNKRARIALARVTIEIPSTGDLTPEAIDIDNLIRPMIRTQNHEQL